MQKENILADHQGISVSPLKYLRLSSLFQFSTSCCVANFYTSQLTTLHQVSGGGCYLYRQLAFRINYSPVQTADLIFPVFIFKRTSLSSFFLLRVFDIGLFSQSRSSARSCRGCSCLLASQPIRHLVPFPFHRHDPSFLENITS